MKPCVQAPCGYGVSNKGSAVVECVIVLLAFIPVLLGMAKVAALITLRQDTIELSRYALWQETTGQSVSMIPQALFTDHGPVQPVLSSTPILSGTAYSLASSVISGGSAIESQSQGHWSQLQRDTLVRTEIEVSGLPGGGVLKEQGVVMVRGWSAASDDQAADSVRSFVPGGSLRKVGQVLAKVGQYPGFKELQSFDEHTGLGVFGYVDMQSLPVSETSGLSVYGSDE